MNVSSTFFSSPLNWQPVAQLHSKLKNVQDMFYIPNPYDSINLAWHKLKEKFTQQSPLRKTVESLCLNPIAKEKWDEALNTLVETCSSTEYHLLRKPLRNILTKLTPKEYGQLFDRLINKGIEGKGLVGLQNALSLLTSEEVENLLQKAIVESKKNPEETLEAFAIAQEEYSKLLTTTKESFFKRQGSTFIRMFCNFIDSALLSLHLTDIGRETTSSWEATEQLYSYAKILSYPVLIFTALTTFCAPLVALIVTGAVVATAAIAIYSYVTWFQAAPNTLESTINMVEEAKMGTLQPVLAREAKIDEILNCLANSSDGHRAHPLLCGPTGVGKTEIVRGIAQRLALGNVPENLKGKKLLAINTAELLERANRSAGDNTLQHLLNRMGKNKDEYIIFFDEVHNAMMKKTLGERMKTILDTNPNSLRYCIGATTQLEYTKHIEPDLAFARRFEKIEVEPTGKEQTVLIMREMLKREAPDVSVDETMLEKIFEMASQKLPNMYQPSSSIHVLAKALGRLKRYSTPQIQKNQQKLANLTSRVHANPEALFEQETLEKIVSLKKKIERIDTEKKAMEQKNQEQTKLILFEKTQISFMFQSALTAHKTASAKDKTTFLFWNYYMLPHIKSKLMAQQVKSSIRIDEKLIESLFVQELG